MSELLNTFFFKFYPISEVNNRTISDNNGTVEQWNDFMSFVSLSYDMVYVYQVSFSYLSPFRRSRGMTPTWFLALQKPRWSCEG